MDFNEYQKQAATTANNNLTYPQRIAMGCIGLAGEAGEIVDEIKKSLFHGKELDLNKTVSEIGDVLWYLSFICTNLDIQLGEAASANIKKLRARHGDSFKNHDDQAR